MVQPLTELNPRSPTGILVYQGEGTPEGVLASGPGALYLDKAAGVLYGKTSGSGNTGWSAYTAVLETSTDGVILAGAVEAARYSGDGTDVLLSQEANVGLTADAGSVQGGGVITSSINVYSTVATIGDAATLPATFLAGTLVYVKNDAANSMDVFPASGDDAGAGVDLAVAVAGGGWALFFATVADSTWTKLAGGATT